MRNRVGSVMTPRFLIWTAGYTILPPPEIKKSRRGTGVWGRSEEGCRDVKGIRNDMETIFHLI